MTCFTIARVSRVVAILAALLAFFAGPASATISYRVSLEHPEQHLFHVTMTVPVDGRELDTAMPVWNALYQIRDFAERIRDVSAICNASIPVPLSVRKVDKQDWRATLDRDCASNGQNIVAITYSVFWNDPGPFDSQLDAHHAFANLAELLMYVPARRAEDVSVQFTDLPAGWRSATALAAVHVDNSYVASSYDTLVDAPVEFGTFDDFSFQAEGNTLVRIVVDGKDWSKGKVEKSLQQITNYDLRLMQGNPFDPPYRSYTFIVHFGPVVEVGGGGMEHRNSTAISALNIDEFAVLAAHEFFHSWNVKRIRPQALEPVDYSKEQYTRALWFAEGVTSTYADYALVRFGLWSKDQFYQQLAYQIGTLESRPARLHQSVEEASIDTWFDNLPEYGDPARSISYYNKGEILGFLLDLEIRDATDNRKSLDDVLRWMNAQAQRGKFYDESDGIRAAVEQIAGKSLEDFFRRYVEGTDELPYKEILAIAGLALESRSPQGANPRFSLAETSHATDRQRRIREGILRGTAQ